MLRKCKNYNIVKYFLKNLYVYPSSSIKVQGYNTDNYIVYIIYIHSKFQLIQLV